MKPTSDMILQMMLDAAEEYGLGWCSGAPYTAGYAGGRRFNLAVTKCCSVGALALAVNRVAMMFGADAYTIADEYLESTGLSVLGMYRGNDHDWYRDDDDAESYAIGAAFRDAMTSK